MMTKTIRKQLDDLRLVGLARYSAMKSAEKAYTDAQSAYRRIAADYLRILGLTEQAENIEYALNSSTPAKYMEELDQINAEWLGIAEA